MNDRIRKDLIHLLKRTEVFDRKTRWISLNRVWLNPETRKPFYEAILRVCQSQSDIPADSLILCPEGIASSFGLLPIVSLVAHELGYRMAIWREFGDIVTTAPSFFPDMSILPRDLSCIILQDVVGRGTTLRKMYRQILDLNWRVKRYIAVVQLTRAEHGLKDNVHECTAILAEDFRFLSILKDSDIGG